MLACAQRGCASRGPPEVLPARRRAAERAKAPALMACDLASPLPALALPAPPGAGGASMAALPAGLASEIQKTGFAGGLLRPAWQSPAPAARSRGGPARGPGRRGGEGGLRQAGRKGPGVSPAAVRGTGPLRSRHRQANLGSLRRRQRASPRIPPEEGSRLWRRVPVCLADPSGSRPGFAGRRPGCRRSRGRRIP